MEVVIQVTIKVILILMIISSHAFGKSSEFDINRVLINCIDNLPCEKFEKTFSSLKRTYSSKKHFYNVFKLYVANEGVKELNIKVERVKGVNTLFLDIKQKPIVLDVYSPRFSGKNSIELPSIIPIKKDEYLDYKKLKDTEKVFNEIAKEKGFPNVKVKTNVEKKDDGAYIQFHIDLGKPILIGGLIINGKSDYLKDFISKRLLSHINSPFDVQFLKTEIEEIKNLLISFGYYLIDFEFKYQYLSKNKVRLFLDIKNTKRYVFYPKKSDFLSETEIKQFLVENLITTKREYANENIGQVLKEKYQKLGFNFASIDVKIKSRHDKNSDAIVY